mgnify:CR=1 FL=1|tara:strand:+ start:861 stop:1313 length:453 start_codon:yes stop_codon:yes gene_type:complete
MNTLNLDNKILRGYISSRDLNGAYYPQNFQNLLIRTFAKENNIKLQLSGTEWIVKNSYVMLRSIIKEKNNGIIFFSLFQIYEDKNKFFNFAFQILKKKKILVFVLENIVLRNLEELKDLLKILRINKILTTKGYLKNIKKIRYSLPKKNK